MMDINNEGLTRKIKTILPLLDERSKRLYLASEAEYIGHGGITVVSEIADVNRGTVSQGLKELKENRAEVPEGHSDQYKVHNVPGLTKGGERRARKEGGGRKTIVEKQPGIVDALLNLVKRECYGNPENPLLYTTKSTRNLAAALAAQDYKVSHTKVYELLIQEGFRVQQNKKLEQVGKKHPDRGAQFEHINQRALEYMSRGLPVISVDCKKKENIGNFKNNGAEFHESGKPTIVLDHDFGQKHTVENPSEGTASEYRKAAPYGVYDMSLNEGFVNVGVSSDTAQFAVASIRNWWYLMGKEHYENAPKMYITADGGGSNSCRNRLWKVELQKLANELNMKIEVSHFPAGTSKWNKIEHRMFSYISMNWRERPLETLEIIVNLIASTTTSTGLKIKAQADMTDYKPGIEVDPDEYKGINILCDEFHGEWNYIICPQSTNAGAK